MAYNTHQFYSKLKANIQTLQRKFPTVLSFLVKFDGVVFFAPYPYQEFEKDGYFQRIKAIDEIIAPEKRIYIEYNNKKKANFDILDNNAYVLRVTGSKIRRIFIRIYALLCVLRSRKVYFHSVYRMQDSRCGEVLRIPYIKAVLDLHGAVPEELSFYNDLYNAKIYSEWEKLAIRKAAVCISVTNMMTEHIKQKYENLVHCSFITIPILPQLAISHSSINTFRPYKNDKPIVIYAGGLQRWQQIHKMADVINKTALQYNYLFYCPNPDDFRPLIQANILPKITLTNKNHSELLKIYFQCHYGLLLREDIIVNRVACPTKLVEYIVSGIVPVLDSPKIGDFKALGLQYVSVIDFEEGHIPDESERLKIAENNYIVYKKLNSIHATSINSLKEFLLNFNRNG